MFGQVSFYWTTEAIKYNVPRPAHRNIDDPSYEINDLQRKHRENSSLAKNPPKFATAYIVQ